MVDDELFDAFLQLVWRLFPQSLAQLLAAVAELIGIVEAKYFIVEQFVQDKAFADADGVYFCLVQ